MSNNMHLLAGVASHPEQLEECPIATWIADTAKFCITKMINTTDALGRCVGS